MKKKNHLTNNSFFSVYFISFCVKNDYNDDRMQKVKERDKRPEETMNNRNAYALATLAGNLLAVNPFRTKTPKYIFPRGNKRLLYDQIGNRNFFIFITNQ